MGKTKSEIRKDVKVAGKDLVVFLNADRAVCENTDVETLHFLREHHSGQWDCKGRPIVFTDDGTRLYIQAAEGRSESLSVHKTTGSGSSKGASKCPPEVLEFLLKQADKEKYPQDVKDWIASFNKPDGRLVKAAKLMNKPVEEITDAELEMLKSLGMID